MLFSRVYIIPTLGYILQHCWHFSIFSSHSNNVSYEVFHSLTLLMDSLKGLPDCSSLVLPSLFSYLDPHIIWCSRIDVQCVLSCLAVECGFSWVSQLPADPELRAVFNWLRSFDRKGKGVPAEVAGSQGKSLSLAGATTPITEIRVKWKENSKVTSKTHYNQTSIKLLPSKTYKCISGTFTHSRRYYPELLEGLNVRTFQ